MEYRSRVDHHLRNFDVYDITCPICMSVFHEPVIVCRNGHSLCSTCYHRCRMNPDCPQCKIKMLPDPIINRIAKASITWFFRTLQEIVPYTKDERVDFNLSKFMHLHAEVGSLPPFMKSGNNPWVSAIVQDIDTVQLEYVIVPDIRPDLLTSICPNRAHSVRVSFIECYQILAPHGAYSECWRTLEWIRQHQINYFYVFHHDENNNTECWTTGLRLWDRAEPSATESILLGFESQNGFERDVGWYELGDADIYPTIHIPDTQINMILPIEESDPSTSDNTTDENDSDDNDFEIHLNNTNTNHPHPTIQTLLT